jgi:hypothetical protein
MFPSISRALPNTQVTTSFRTSLPAVLVLPVQDAYGNPFNVTVNNGAVQTGQVPGGNATTWTVTLTAGQLITAIVTSPPNNLEHAFYEYTIDGVYQNFAVVCESLYTIKVIPAAARKRWYDYGYTSNPAYSLRQSNGAITTPTVYSNKGPITVNSHVVINPFTKSLYFYDSVTGIQTSVIAFPAPPIDYQILASHNKIVVLTHAGSWYEIDMASNVAPLPPLDSTARCLGYSSVTDLIWIGGATTCWAYRPGPAGGMQLYMTCAVTEQIVGIAPIPNAPTAALAVSVNSNVYILDTVTGAVGLPVPSTAIGQPIAFGNYIYIPDGNNAQLLVYNCITTTFDPAVLTTGYSPKYTLVRDNKLYVTNNDSPDVLVFDSTMNMTVIRFKDKVTMVSASGSTIISSHFLDTITTTLAPGLTRIVDVAFDNRSGPITHIGSNSVKIITVGYQIVTGYTAGRTVLWVSGVKSDSAGVRGVDIIDGSTVNISYRVATPGISQVSAVIGDSAYDYRITAFVERYYPRYIDFAIGDSNNPSYTQTITMPNKMTPATMAIEYGDLKLNGIVYDGSTKVYANDVIDISITLGNPYGYGKGMLPIFSLGARQFAIPISADPVPVITTVVSDTNLTPNTALTKTQTISGLASLYDFILPDYYNVKISKRITAYSIPGVPPTVSNVDVSGNYYQHFDAGDILVVDYNSSVKLYDTEVVYILGPDNYKFTAVNQLPFLINYLDYGTLSDPYTRDFEPLTSGFGKSLMGASGAITYVPETAHASDMQVVTANVQIVGYITTQGNAVLTLTGGDAKFILNGDTAAGSNVTLTSPTGNTDVITNAVVVYNGDQVAVGRNVQSYFDGNITVIQNMLDIESDFVTIDVGKWRIVNQTVKEVVFQSQETAAKINRTPSLNSADNTSIHSLDYAADIAEKKSVVIDYAADEHNVLVNKPYGVDYDRPTLMLGISALQWLQETMLIPHATTLQWQQETTMVPVSSVLQWLQETMLIPQLTTLQWQQETTMVPAARVLQWLQETTMVPAARVLQWLQETTMVPQAGIIEWLQETTMVPAASVREWLQETTMTPNSSRHEWLQETTMVPQAGILEWLQETTMAPKSSQREWQQDTTMVPKASQREWQQDTTMVPKASQREWQQDTTMVPDASHHELQQDTTMAVKASRNDLLQDTTMVPDASHHELQQDTTMVAKASGNDLYRETTMAPAASQHNLTQDTTFAVRSSTHALLQENSMAPAASQHSLSQDSEYNITASKKELYRVDEFLISSSTMSLEHLSTPTHTMAPTEWNNLVNLELPMVPVDIDHLPVEQIYVNSPAVEHKIYIDSPAVPWAKEYLANPSEQPTVPNVYSKYFVLDSNAYDFNRTDYNFTDSRQDYRRSFFAPEIEIGTIPGFVGERYTPVNSVFNRSIEGRPTLILADIERTPYLNYDYEPTSFIRENKDIFNSSTNPAQEPVQHYVPIGREFGYETVADIEHVREFTRENYHDVELTANYDMFKPRQDNLLAADYETFKPRQDTLLAADYETFKSRQDSLFAADYERANADNRTALVVDYTPDNSDINRVLVIDYQQGPADPKNIVPADYEAARNLLSFTVKPEYQQIINTLSFQVKPEYQQIINTLSFQVKPEYQQIIDHLSFTVKADYEQIIDHLSFQVKADYQQDLPMSIYGNATKLDYAVDPELLWKQDLSTDYFVFNTAQDALDKAHNDGYTNYAAYQVYDTPYYSYRILIDTALVCKLPKGRYPIAWLLHGG